MKGSRAYYREIVRVSSNGSFRLCDLFLHIHRYLLIKLRFEYVINSVDILNRTYLICNNFTSIEINNSELIANVLLLLPYTILRKCKFTLSRNLQ